MVIDKTWCGNPHCYPIRCDTCQAPKDNPRALSRGLPEEMGIPDSNEGNSNNANRTTSGN